MLPHVSGVSDLQRHSKKVLLPIKEDTEEVILLSERNHVFGAIVNIRHYEELLKMAMDKENDFWLKASESSLDFWNDPSNDAYEKHL